MLRRSILAFAALLSVPTGSPAQMETLETANLRLIYAPATHDYLIPHVARCFENSLRFHEKLFDYRPSEKVTVILTDLSDISHASAVASPRNTLLVNIAPASRAYETYPANERMNTTMNHEVVHLVALDRAAGSDRFFRRLLGGKVTAIPEHPESVLYEYLTTPRRAAPRWYHEGIAVFIETWMAGGLGRAQGAYDEMVFRSMVRDGSHFYDPLGLASERTNIDFQGMAAAYLYGTRFITYLAYEHTPESVLEWVSRSSGSRMYYAKQFEKQFGRTIEKAWSEWIGFEHRFQRANLDSIRQYPVTPYKDLSRRALGSVSRAHFDPVKRMLYAAVNYPGTIAHVAAIAIDTGDIRKIRDVKGPLVHTVASLARDPDSGTLYYTTDNGSWRDLLSLDPDTGEAEVLAKDMRVGELVFSSVDKALWGIRHHNGISTLVRIPSPYEGWQSLYSWPYGTGISDIDISPDGRLLSASVAEISGRQTLRVMDIDLLFAGDTTVVAEREFGSSVPSNFMFSPDGKYLYGSSYYTGASNIFRYDFAADSLDALTNAETGFFRPIPLGGDSLIVFRYSGEGFVPALIEAPPLEDVSAIKFLGAELAEKHPVVQSWMAGSPADIDLESITKHWGEYRASADVGLTSAYPIVEGYKDFTAYGIRLDLSDPAYVHRFDVSTSFSPEARLKDDERLHVRARYQAYRGDLVFRWNAADFYDLFGPTKTSRKGQSLGFNYRWQLIRDSPRDLQLHAGLTGYRALQRLPAYQNVVSSFDKLVTGSTSLRYTNVDASIGAVDYEKGLDWECAVAANAANGQVFPSFRGDFDFGVAVPPGHSSFWLRSSAGFSPSDRAEPFANFFFGGFGNNWVDRLSPKRYREHYAFPGVELNEIGGRNYGKTVLEWNLPPLRFARAGTPGFYLTWARGSLFSSVIATNVDDGASRRFLTDLGAQVDLRLMFLSTLSLTASGGWAVSFEDGRRKDDELMISLKVL
jgi:hypothetical protein